MGEVWRARDTKLGRDVAIKTLPQEFSKDSERLSRFEREARLLASVNHPNIAAIYGLEESAGTRFLVLELVDGETLAERLRRPTLTVQDSLTIALQISQALEAAHENGVIHRDLKPGNIKLTPDGKVKVLDFGLAKALAPSTEDMRAGSGAMSNSPTMSLAATQQGVILGTAGYMSPEQARGEATDRRTDIWAFGCVLFEMLARRSTFEGRTVSDVLAGVLRAEPDWKCLPPDLHPRIKLLLERCLEKEPRDRYRDIADARVDIEKVLADPAGSLPKAVAAASAGNARSGLWVAAVVLTALVAGAAVWFLKPSPDSPPGVSRFDYDLPEGHQIRAPLREAVAVSPDGRRFAYNTNDGIYLRSMDAFDARVIPGTETGLTSLAFSPDGSWIVFWSADDNKLKKIAVSGGTAVTLCDAVNPQGVSWSRDGTILFGQFQGIMRVSENGGVPELIIKTGSPEQTSELASSPQLLPDGKSVLFTLSTVQSGVTDWDRARIMVESLDTKERKIVWSGGTHGRYVKSGHLVYLVGNVLFAVKFDPGSLTVKGGPVPVVEGISRPTVNSMVGQYGFSDSGALIYLRGLGATVVARRILALVDRRGGVTPLNVPPAPYLHPRISPDGSRVAVQTLDESNRSAIWVYDLSGNRAIQQLTQAGNNSRPIWTPDGKRLTFMSDRDGTRSIYWQPADGSGAAERLTKAEEKIEHWPDSWSADGKTLSFTRFGGLGNQSVWTLQVDPKSEGKDLGSKESGGSAFSPDGKWIAYRQLEGVAQIFVQPFPTTGAVYKVTQRGGSYPIWSHDQSEMFYRRPLTGNNPTAESAAADQLVSVQISTRGIVGYSNEQTIPIQGFLMFFGSRDYDITKDGKNFLMVFPADRAQSRAPARPQIDIVLNWFEELKQRVP